MDRRHQDPALPIGGAPRRGSALCRVAVAFTMTVALAAAAALLAAVPAPAAPAPALRLLRVTPAGVDVPPGRQVVLQFDRAVVPLGRMEREASEIPVGIEPDPGCQWRWINTSALACQLGEETALRPATRYEVSVRPGLVAEDGAGLAGPELRWFVTERPAVGSVGFRTWLSPTLPVTRVVFNQPVTRPSVAEHVFFRRPEEAGSRIAPVVEPDPDIREGAVYLPLPGEKAALVADLPPQASDDQATPVGGIEARRVWLVKPERELPADAAMELAVEPGLVSAAGPERGGEDRAAVAFDTFPSFALLGVRCTTNTGTYVLARPGATAAERCDPLSRISLAFASPVTVDEVRDHLRLEPDLAGGREDYDPWAKSYRYSLLEQPHKRGREYLVWLPEVLRGYQEYRVELGPLADEFGRPLVGASTLSFFTDHRKPRLHLEYPRAVLESGVDSEIPAVVTNLRAVSTSYDRVTATGIERGLRTGLAVPKVEDVAFAIPLGLRGMLEGGSGAVSATVRTEPAAEVTPYWAGGRFFAQVTPFQVHVKLGHFTTAVWVTDLATGEPVADALVSVHTGTYDDLPAGAEGAPQARTGADGVATLPGSETLDPKLELHVPWDEHRPRLFVRVARGADLALVPLDRQFHVDAGRVSGWSVRSAALPRHGHLHAWGTTAQGVYRLGDTMQYKVWVRAQDNETFVPPPREGYALEILDPTGTVVHKVPGVRLSEFGAYDGEFPVPERGAVGWYRFRLACDFREEPLEPMRVLVSDFTPSPFRVTTELAGELFRPGDEVEVTTLAKLHAGGPWADAQSRVVASLAPLPFRPRDPAARGFRFDVYRPGAAGGRPVHRSEAALDAEGARTTRFTLPDGDLLYGRLTVESAVRDDRGKNVAAAATAGYAGRDRFVGLRSARWLATVGEPAEVSWLVVDAGGAPAPGTVVTLAVERRETLASRVKGAGDAYLTQYVHRWVPSGSGEGLSGEAASELSFVPDAPGSWRVTASIVDTQGRVQSTALHLWVAGKGEVLWEQPDDGSLGLVPEKDRFAVGETARYLVKNPFPGATALVTLERYGVVRHWVQKLEGATPVVEFEVGPELLPGFFVSVVVVSPRVEAPPPERGQVDLGKPAFRLGYAAATVDDPHHEIEVQVQPEREVYRPRETVRAEIRALPRSGGAEGAPIELAVAVLDEAVFDLILKGRGNFDPYRGFYTLDGLDLENFSLLTRLVGRQQFEKKGADAGGGGGADLSVRSDFRFVAYWNPALAVDAEGRARIEFEVPDNLTGWRVLAMAATPGDRMGLGEGTFRVNRPTELRPAMPNQVVEGDRFEAAFTVMNRTGERRELAVSVAASGSVAGPEDRNRVERTVGVEPFQRQTVSLPVQTAGPGAVVFTAAAGDAADRDAVRHEVPVRARRSLLTAAQYGAIPAQAGGVEREARVPVLFPEGVHTDVGGVSVVGAPSVLGNLEGAFRYLRDYPYPCWEQILSRGVMAASYRRLRGHLAADFAWEGAEGLPQEALDRARGFQAPNGGMAFWVPRDEYVSPYLSAYTALAFGWLAEAGYEVPAQVEERLQGYLDGLLRRDVVPDFYSGGMTATVRAVALAALARRGKIGAADVERYRRHLPVMSLFGKAHFLQAALAVEGGGGLAAEALRQILAAGSESAGKFQFTEPWDDGYSRILATPLRANCAILAALARANGAAGAIAPTGDEPFRLVRTITQSRGSRDHWENTQENVFCMNALADYAGAWEAAAPRMTFRAYLDDRPFGEAAFEDLRDRPVTFERPLLPGDPGRRAEVRIERDGAGRLYWAARVRYAPTAEAADRVNAGIEVRREYSVERDGAWVLLASPVEVRRGELVRIDLYLSLPAARTFVVVDDPVPGGLEPVNRDLATASVVDADKGRFQAAGGSWWFHYGEWSEYGVSRWSFYHRELRHDSARFYADYLGAGNYHLSYTAQAIAPGEFAAGPVHAEEMYDPDVFGTGLPAFLRVAAP